VDYWRSAVEYKSTTAQFGGLYAIVGLQSRRYDSMFFSENFLALSGTWASRCRLPFLHILAVAHGGLV
jgi:hypothetical protein